MTKDLTFFTKKEKIQREYLTAMMTSSAVAKNLEFCAVLHAKKFSPLEGKGAALWRHVRTGDQVASWGLKFNRENED